MPSSYFKDRLFDVRPDRLDLRDRPYRPPLRSLPAHWPPRKRQASLLTCYRACGMILDQGQEGACTGFALAAVINYLIWRDKLRIKGNKLICPKNMRRRQVSARMLYTLARLYDEWEGEDYEGSSCRGAMKGWHRHGVCRATTWPYVTGRPLPPAPGWQREAARTPLGAYYRINRDAIADMQAAIHEVGAIYCSARIHAGWDLPTKSFDAPPLLRAGLRAQGLHAFALIGYTPDGFLLQNSWGPGWGYHGFATLPYADWLENGADAWVAVRGAPVLAESPRSYAHHPLQAQARAQTTRTGRRSVASTSPRTTDARPAPSPTHPLSMDAAYTHTLLLGNDGRPLRTLIDQVDADATALEICEHNIRRWLRTAPPGAPIAVYAHGGLTSRKAALDKVRVMAPYFLANGIYPLFIVWQTGLAETLSHQIDDLWHALLSRLERDAPRPKTRGLFAKWQDPLDQAIERAARIGVRGLWTEMKENARRASLPAVPGFARRGPRARSGGMALLATALERLRADHDFSLHMVGHSAGSILLGHWLPQLRRRGLHVETTTLLAPACTTTFANRYFARAVQAGALASRGLHVYMLDDEREHADRVGPYGKSLLYLVSRALEDVHKMPLLGLDASWHPAALQKDGVFNSAQHGEIRRWQDFARKHARKTIYGRTRAFVATSRNGRFMPLSHGSFDNDIEVIGQTLARIAGRKALQYEVTDLSGA